MPGIIFQRKSLTENKLMFPIFPSCTSLHTLHTSVFPLFPALRSQYITEVHLLKISQFEKTKTFNCATILIYQRPSCNFCKYKQFKAGHIVLLHKDNWDKAGHLSLSDILVLSIGGSSGEGYRKCSAVGKDETSPS